MEPRYDALGQLIEVGDLAGAQVWGHKGVIKEVIVTGFTEKKIRVKWTVVYRDGTKKTVTGHAYANDLVVVANRK